MSPKFIPLIFYQFVIYCLMEKTTNAKEMQFRFIEQRRELKDKLDTRRLLWIIPDVRSVIICGKHCISDGRCMTFFYNRIRDECRGHSITLTNSSEAVEDEGSQYYLTTEAMGFIGDSCQHDTDCVTQNAECIDKQCTCTPGYSFSPTQHTCSAACSEYGEDFRVVPGYFIHEHNLLTYLFVSLEECKKKCRDAPIFTCKSFDYGEVSLRCTIQAVTKLDVPLWWFKDIYYFEYSYYQRDCV